MSGYVNSITGCDYPKGFIFTVLWVYCDFDGCRSLARYACGNIHGIKQIIAEIACGGDEYIAGILAQRDYSAVS